MPAAPTRPVPVFPLPGFVLFPHVLAPFHVFELRDRTLVRDALSSERLIAIALLDPDGAREDHGSPAFRSPGCLARIEEVEWLPNDCYNLKLLGLARVELGTPVREFPYRAVRPRLRPQDPYSEDDMLVRVAREPVLALYRARVAGAGSGEALPFEALVNAVCMGLGDPEERHALLAMDSVIDRGRRACEIAARRPRPPRPGPPAAGDHN